MNRLASALESLLRTAGDLRLRTGDPKLFAGRDEAFDAAVDQVATERAGFPPPDDAFVRDDRPERMPRRESLAPASEPILDAALPEEDGLPASVEEPVACAAPLNDPDSFAGLPAGLAVLSSLTASNPRPAGQHELRPSGGSATSSSTVSRPGTPVRAVPLPVLSAVTAPRIPSASPDDETATAETSPPTATRLASLNLTAVVLSQETHFAPVNTAETSSAAPDEPAEAVRPAIDVSRPTGTRADDRPMPAPTRAPATGAAPSARPFHVFPANAGPDAATFATPTATTIAGSAESPVVPGPDTAAPSEPSRAGPAVSAAPAAPATRPPATPASPPQPTAIAAAEAPAPADLPKAATSTPPAPPATATGSVTHDAIPAHPARMIAVLASAPATASATAAPTAIVEPGLPSPHPTSSPSGRTAPSLASPWWPDRYTGGRPDMGSIAGTLPVEEASQQPPEGPLRAPTASASTPRDEPAERADTASRAAIGAARPVPEAPPAGRPASIGDQAIAPTALPATEIRRLSGAILDLARGAAGPAPATTAIAGIAPHGPLRVMALQLNPGDLGEVVVKLRLNGGRLAVRIEAREPDTARMIEEDGATLARLVGSDGGYHAEIVAVAVGPEARAISSPAANPNPGDTAPARPGEGQAEGRRQPDGQRNQHPDQARQPVRITDDSHETVRNRGGGGSVYV